MNKQELVIAMVDSTDLSKKEAEKAVQGFMEAVSKTLAKGENVTLFGFGTFIPVQRRARVSRNLQTGEQVPVPARIAIKFRAGKHLGDLVALADNGSDQRTIREGGE